MKQKKSSKKNSKHSDFDSNNADSTNFKGKSVKKDKSSKRRLSIYDDFDDEPLDSYLNFNDDYPDD